MTTNMPRFLRDLLASPPPAGQGVHLWLFRVARHLHAHYTDKAEMARLLEAACHGCGREVSLREIEDAIQNSEVNAWRPHGNHPEVVRPTLTWPAPQLEEIEAIAIGGPGLVGLWEASPLRLEDSDPHSEEIIDRLFPDNPLLCCGWSNSKFDTRSRQDWRGELAGLQFIVPSPMTATTGLTKQGKPSKHALDNTGPRRFLIVECDFSIHARDGKTETPYAPLIRKLNRLGFEVVDICAGVLLHLAHYAPLVCVVHSGGKSLHGWFFCTGETEGKLLRFMRYAVSLGADRATWSRSQFVRIPDGTRDSGMQQTVFFLNYRVLDPIL